MSDTNVQDIEVQETVRTHLFIGGAARDTEDCLEVSDPANPSVSVGFAAAATTQDGLDAIAAAKAAFPAWSALKPRDRAGQIRDAISEMEATRMEDARILSMENGKVLQESIADLFVLELRTGLAIDLADTIDQETELPGPPMTTRVGYQPLGVVTIIVPFNWPLAILGASLPYALMAGNTVIVKPPPSAPLAVSQAVGRIAAKLPAGVLNVITGRDQDLSPLIDHGDVAKVSFTGSVGGGKKIAELASTSLTRVTLELGGNDPAIIFDDAVLDDAALDRLFTGIFDSTGQICMAAKRVYVQRTRYDDVVAGLSERLDKVVLGHGLDPHTTMGPLHSPRQKEFVDALIDEAKNSGAEVREFGQLPGGELADGNFVRPALVLDPDPSLRVVTEEQFGPVIPIIPFDDEDEAISVADDTWGGLCASVWSADRDRVERVGKQLTVGFVFVNDHGAGGSDLRAPFGGMRSSGYGREQGIEGVRDFQDTRSIGYTSF